MGGERGGTESLSADVTEQDLVQRLQAGDTDAFETVFRQHFPKVYRQALHLLGAAAEAEEVVQEVFLTVYEKAHVSRRVSLDDLALSAHDERGAFPVAPADTPQRNRLG